MRKKTYRLLKKVDDMKTKVKIINNEELNGEIGYIDGYFSDVYSAKDDYGGTIVCTQLLAIVVLGCDIVSR